MPRDCECRSAGEVVRSNRNTIVDKVSFLLPIENMSLSFLAGVNEGSSWETGNGSISRLPFRLQKDRFRAS